MSFTTSSSSTTLHSLLEVCREFARQHPPSTIAVSVRCNREFIDKLKSTANGKSTVIGTLATTSPELIVFGVKIIEDDSVLDGVHYVKYADGREEMVTPFGTFSREA